MEEPLLKEDEIKEKEEGVRYFPLISKADVDKAMSSSRIERGERGENVEKTQNNELNSFLHDFEREEFLARLHKCQTYLKNTIVTICFLGIIVAIILVLIGKVK